MRVFFKRALLTLLFAVMISPAAIAATNKTSQEAGKPPVILRIDGRDITKDYYDAAFDRLLPLMSFHKSVSPERLRLIKKRALEDLVNSEIIYNYAKANNKLKVDEKTIDMKLEEIKKKLQGKSLDEVLAKSHITMEGLKHDLAREIVISRINKEKSDEFKKKATETVTTKYMQDYYNNNLEKFKEPAQLHIRTLLIKADPSGGARVWAASRKKIEGILAEINKGMDFAAAAKKYSEDPYAKDGGDMGWVHEGSVVQELGDAIAGLKVGQIAGPFTSLYGYHLAKIEGKKPSVQRKFNSLNLKKLKVDLTNREYKRLWDDWLKDQKSHAKIEYLMDVKDIK